MDECIAQFAAGREGAQALNDILVRRAGATEGSTSWLADWWTQYAYLATREPLPPKEGSVFQRIFPEVHGQAGVAAATVRAHLWALRMIETRQIPKMERGVPICLAQYDRLYGGCRIPHTGCDTVAQSTGTILPFPSPLLPTPPLPRLTHLPSLSPPHGFPASAFPISSRPISPIPAQPSPARSIPFRPVPSHTITSQPIPSHPITSNIIPYHYAPYHTILSPSHAPSQVRS